MASISVDGSAAVLDSVNPRSQNPATQSTAQQAAERAAARQELAARVREAAESAEAAPSPEELQAAAADIGDYISLATRSLNIRVDSDLQRPVVTVFDADTDEVVRQIPSEEALAISRFIRSQRDNAEEQLALAGVILNEQG